jgi:hypothetical protein
MHYQHPELEVVRAALDYAWDPKLLKYGRTEKPGYGTFCDTPENHNLGKSLKVLATVSEMKFFTNNRPSLVHPGGALFSIAPIVRCLDITGMVMIGFGWNSDWLRNIETTPSEEVVISTRHFQASHRFLAEEEAVNVVENYERRNRLVASLVRWVLSRLLGWQYRGSTDDRRRLVGQLPLIAFRPRS